MTSYLKVIKPATVTLDTTDAVESLPAWDIGTSYPEDELVAHETRIWRSSTDGHVGNEPETGSAYWTDMRATNPYRCLDLKQTSQTEADGSLTMTLTSASTGDAIGLLGITAATVQVTVSESGTEYFDSGVRDLIRGENVYDMFSYCYGPIERTDKLILSVPIFAGSEITITLNAGSGTAALAELVIGQTYLLGVSMSDDISLESYSTKEKNEWGEAYIRPGDHSFRHDFVFAADKSRGDWLLGLMSELESTPSLYFAAEDQMEYGATVFGWIDDWSQPLQSERTIFVRAVIEGLT